MQPWREVRRAGSAHLDSADDTPDVRVDRRLPLLFPSIRSLLEPLARQTPSSTACSGSGFTPAKDCLARRVEPQQVHYAVADDG